jgi:Ca2+/Na+ antiporter
VFAYLTNDELFLLILTFSIISAVVILSFRITEKKNRPFIFSIVLIYVLIFSAFASSNFAIQLLELIAVMILILYIVFSTIYPRLFSEQEHQFYQPRKPTIWDLMRQQEQEEKGASEQGVSKK